MKFKNEKPFLKRLTRLLGKNIQESSDKTGIILNTSIDVLSSISELLSGTPQKAIKYPLTILRITAKIRDALNDCADNDLNSAFTSSDWHQVNFRVTGTIFDCIKHYDYVVNRRFEALEHRTYVVNGQEFYIEYSINDNCAEKIFVRTDEKERAFNIITELFWDKFPKYIELIETSCTNSRSRFCGEQKYSFEAKMKDKIYLSNNLIELVEYIKKFNLAEINRSIVLYGPTGSGKTTISEGIVRKLGYRAIKIPVNYIHSLMSLGVFEDLLLLFKPEALIIDDYDKAGGCLKIYDELERINKSCKLLIVTINNLNSFSQNSAVIRPGRCDEIIEISKIDERVIIELLGQENIELLEQVKDWPIAYIVELVKRIKVLNNKQEQINNLSKRIEALKSKYDKMNCFNVDEDIYDRGE